ncbi:unnamed protein product [Brachionus calyciflorus]|uniref:valine--tRNA ligase n=1 Tax=Brachionus calyciflorus TaxID=104777 RepID=A0A814FI64_9BILA|nr:unnamed protein product [Brachionus calyciflorus]
MSWKILESKSRCLNLVKFCRNSGHDLISTSQIFFSNKSYYSVGQKPNQNLDVHNPSEIQTKWYELWQKKLKEFNKNDDRKTFSMLFPPPNVTGNLHLGHAITSTIQDAIVRWKLMNNFKVFWIPGYDHAGIATQVVVEKKIWNEKKMTRHQLGKEKFVEEVFKWKEEKSQTIKEQMIKLNTLNEWDYQYFTMDKNISDSVDEAFIRLFEKGHIHRAFRPINWCCSLKSSISDAEVENISINKRTSLKIPNYKKPVEFGLIYKIAYPVENSNDEIVVATTRPETLFGDTALAVNPDDSRFYKYHGKSVRNPLTNEIIPIILDKNVDKNFHTGAVKITPFHDINDYETGIRHNLPIKQIFNEEGCLINVPKEFLNVPRFEARLRVIDKLKSLNLLREIKEHEMVLPVCSRTGDIIEPFLKDQWFVKSSQVFKICNESVQDGSLKLIPDFRANLWNHYVKTYDKDWCISRQLWWGQKIPAYKCWPKSDKINFKWFAAHTKAHALKKAYDHFKTQDIEILQDEDVFDTWFTSTILPLAALGWPNNPNSNRLPYEKLYPTNLLETGFDIMYFWAYRMVGMCHALSGQIPYSQILFHGLIRDSQGRKMSKSIGNVIDPIDLIDGASLDELKNRILTSNLDNREKMISSKNQEKMYPNGIEAVGSDATRLALLVQDFKTHSSNTCLEVLRYIVNPSFKAAFNQYSYSSGSSYFKLVWRMDKFLYLGFH